MKKKPRPLLTERESTGICGLLHDRWGHLLAPGTLLTVEADHQERSVRVQLTLSQVDGSSEVCLEAGLVDHTQTKRTVEEALHFLLDALDGALGQYLESGGLMPVTLEWREVEFEGVKIRMRGEERHPLLSAMADEWLAERDGESD